MKKIFALHPIQQILINKHCFGDCGKILIGCLNDPEAGAMFPCGERVCSYEEKRMRLGTIAEGKEVWIRKLKDDTNVDIPVSPYWDKMSDKE